MLCDEIRQLHSLTNIGLALVDYTQSLFPGLRFTATSQPRYVSEPENFIAFWVHHKRVQNIVVTLRGNRNEFPPFPELPLKPNMGGYGPKGGYCSFTLTEAKQLAAACMYIKRAAEIYRRGRERQPKTLKIVEVS